MLPLLYKLDNDEEANTPDMWVKANPSLPFFPELKKEMDKDFVKIKYQPHKKQDFFTKRLNLPRSDMDMQVTEFDNLIACSKEIPDLAGCSGVVGIDYAKVSDFASAGVLIQKDGIRYWVSHSWICSQSPDIPRIRAPWRDWVDMDLMSVVDDVEISPDIIVDWIASQMEVYNITNVALDNFRYGLLSRSLDAIGFSKKMNKNVYLVQPSDIMKTAPIIDSCFTRQGFAWGENPLMRWAVNNTKLVRSSRNIGVDTGNFIYGKIEAKSRKTDPFMALVAAMVVENTVEPAGVILADDLPAMTW